MRVNITPTTLAVVAGLVVSARLLTAGWTTRQTGHSTQQLTDAHRAGYTLALTHVSRGLLTAAPEEP